MNRILYIQYTNPAGYPPLQHSSRILADAGWQVLFLGTRAQGSAPLRFPPHDNVRARYLNFYPGGWRQKLHYLLFCLWVFGWAILWRARWIYASDPLAAPSALGLSYLPWLRAIYHEHDSPGEGAPNRFQCLVLDIRRRLACRANLCILPNEARLERFKRETGTARAAVCVWNCPSRQEVAPQRQPASGDFWILYHGSIVPERLPLAVVSALAKLQDEVKLRIIGYETAGSTGYVGQLLELARKLSVGHRLDVVGAVPLRCQLLDWCRQCDLGLALMPMSPNDANQLSMTGASNKAFDYLACGLPLVVSDLPDWLAMYVQPGYGLACDPDDPDSIARAIYYFVKHRAATRAMGEEGRQRILTDWNYESQFRFAQRRLDPGQNQPSGWPTLQESR